MDQWWETVRRWANNFGSKQKAVKLWDGKCKCIPRFLNQLIIHLDSESFIVLFQMLVSNISCSPSRSKSLPCGHHSHTLSNAEAAQTYLHSANFTRSRLGYRWPWTSAVGFRMNWAASLHRTVTFCAEILAVWKQLGFILITVAQFASLSGPLSVSCNLFHGFFLLSDCEKKSKDEHASFGLQDSVLHAWIF